jgi:glutamine amidotransferase
MTRVAVVDYGAGNMVSISRALAVVGAEVVIARRPADLAGARGLVVPGVGASGPAMRRLARIGMVQAIGDAVRGGATYLGICLGMQLLFERSEEDGARGLGLLPGVVQTLPDAPRLPHIGWNPVEIAPVDASGNPHPLLAGVPSGAACYFVHSYAPVPTDPSIVIARTEHGGRFVSAIAHDRLLGVQFHPERSGAVGLRILRNFVRLAAGESASATTAEAAA